MDVGAVGKVDDVQVGDHRAGPRRRARPVCAAVYSVATMIIYRGRGIWTKRIPFYSISIWLHDHHDTDADDDDNERTRHNDGGEDDEHAEDQM